MDVFAKGVASKREPGLSLILESSHKTGVKVARHTTYVTTQEGLPQKPMFDPGVSPEIGQLRLMT